MAILSKSDILEARDIPTEEVEVPEWGGSVVVKGLTGAERDRFESSVIEQKGSEQSLNLANVRAKLCAMAICDAEGNRLFTEADVLALSKKSASALNRVFVVAQKLSGLGEQEIKELTEGMSSPFEGSASG